MANVVRLNLCYGVPVKLYSGHLLLMALWLIWPDLPRIFSALVLNRATVSVEEIRPWSGNPRTRLLAVALKTVLVGRALYQSVGAQIENQSTNIERFGLTRRNCVASGRRNLSNSTVALCLVGHGKIPLAHTHFWRLSGRAHASR